MSIDNFKFLVIGAGRGGTSVLAGLLDHHPMLEVGFEIHSAAYLMGKSFPYAGPDLFDRRIRLFMAACRETATQHPNRIWGNKITTEQLFGLEDHNKINPASKMDVLEMFFGTYFRNMKIIFILRDGRTCINSKVQRTGQSMEIAASRWQRSVMCYKYLRERHSNSLCIRYEDLLFHPQETLSELCEFLDISYTSDMLTGTNNQKMLPEYRRGTLDLSRVKEISLPEDILCVISDDLRYAGYL